MSDADLKKQLIRFIKTNAPSSAEHDLETYSITQLIIVKTGIESALKDLEKVNRN